MRAGEKVLAEKLKELEGMYKRRVDPYVLIFWISVTLMVVAVVLGIGMLFV